MYLGSDEWAVTPVTGGTNRFAFSVYDSGRVGDSRVGDEMLAVRPVFNLVSSVTYVSGDGTQNSPILIN